MAKRLAGIDEANAEVASPRAALFKKDLLFMIIVFCEDMK